MVGTWEIGEVWDLKESVFCVIKLRNKGIMKIKISVINIMVNKMLTIE
jgi:hypothetical protein